MKEEEEHADQPKVSRKRGRPRGSKKKAVREEREEFECGSVDGSDSEGHKMEE